jgi:hypothetical protein
MNRAIAFVKLNNESQHMYEYCAHSRSVFSSNTSIFFLSRCQCMGEIANLKFDDHPKVGEYTQKFQQAFVSLMERCVRVLASHFLFFLRPYETCCRCFSF